MDLRFFPIRCRRHRFIMRVLIGRSVRGLALPDVGPVARVAVDGLTPLAAGPEAVTVTVTTTVEVIDDLGRL